MAKIQFEEIIKKFADNGSYTLDENVKCTGYACVRRTEDIGMLLHACSFDDEKEDLKAPKITLHDRTMLYLIAKYGVINFSDLRTAMQLRKEKEQGTFMYTVNNNSEFKQMLDRKLVNKGLAVRCRIDRIYNEGGQRQERREYIYSCTKLGAMLVNKSMDKSLKDNDSLRILDDLNLRDKLGRMALTHVALRFVKNGYSVLQNHYSKTAYAYDRFPMLLYNNDKNCEVMMQYLYLQRNAELETEDEFQEKIWALVKAVFDWLSSESVHEKDRDPAKRRVILCCNNLRDYDLFLSCLINKYSRTNYCELVEYVYATSVGFLDAGAELKDSMYHHKKIKEIAGVLQPIDDEVDFND